MLFSFKNVTLRSLSNIAYKNKKSKICILRVRDATNGFDMKKILSYFALTFLFVGMNVVSLTAQENYIIVKTAEEEIISFSPSSIERLYIENQQWVFELKGSEQQYRYPLGDILPFTMITRNPSNIPLIQSDWNIYDDGDNLIISNPNGIVGNYTIYDLSGKLIKRAYESTGQAVISLPSAQLYIIKADGKAKKVIKR